MGLTVTGLRRAHTVRLWRNIFRDNPYVAVVQLTGGRSWGRANMRARVLGADAASGGVDAKYAVPWAARAAVEQTRYVGLSNLFRSAPCAVIYGRDVGAVLSVVARARGLLDGGIVVGGRFGSEVVASRAWDAAADIGSDDAARADLLRVLAASAPPLVQVLDSGARGMVRAVGAAGGAERLARVLGAAAAGEGAGVDGAGAGVDGAGAGGPGPASATG